MKTYVDEKNREAGGIFLFFNGGRGWWAEVECFFARKESLA